MQAETVVGTVLKLYGQQEGLSSNRKIAGRVGCSHTTIDEVVNGKRKLSQPMASRLERANLGSAAEWLVWSTIDKVADTSVDLGAGQPAVTVNGDLKIEVKVAVKPQAGGFRDRKWKSTFWKSVIASIIGGLIVMWVLPYLV